MANTDGSTTARDTNAELNISCLDFLLIELVPLSFRLELSKYLSEHPTRVPTGSAPWTSLSPTERDLLLTSALGIGEIGGGAPLIDPEDLREKVWHRLNTQGYRVGKLLAERYTRDIPRLGDGLEKMKFICKDLWSVLYHKHVDNLKTNHRGTFVLTDHVFRGLKNASLETGTSVTVTASGAATGSGTTTKRDLGAMMAQAQCFLYFHAGVVRGALAALGLETSVQAECVELPGVTFHIRTIS
jgi:hypothetical protein